MLTAVVKRALEFAEFLATVTDANTVRPGARSRPRESPTASSSSSRREAPPTAYEELERMDAAIVGHGAVLSRLSELFAIDAIPFPLTWRTYPSVLELKAEYAVHIATLRDADATAAERGRCSMRSAFTSCSWRIRSAEVIRVAA